MNKKKKLYSYVRWSSGKQSEGSTQERQVDYAKRIAIQYDLELVESITDSGVSAFKGDNVETGALGAFLGAVRSGQVPKGSWLCVENLDRLSRQAVRKALGTFNSILDCDITIVTGMDDKVYTAESVDRNPTELMYSLLLFARAHEESLTKSERTNKAAYNQIEKAKDPSQRSEDGFAVAVTAVGSNKWWCDCSSGFVKPHSVYFPIVRQVVEKIKEGWGVHRIKGWLDATATPPKQQKNKQTLGWSLQALKTLHLDYALSGEKVITLGGIEHVIEDYYPKVIEKHELELIREGKRNRTNRQLGRSTVGVITGIGIAKCGHCGGPIHVFTSKAGKPYEALRYVCDRGRKKASSVCGTGWSVDSSKVEDTLIRVCMEKVWQTDTRHEHQLKKQLEGLHSLRNKAEERVNGWLDRIDEEPTNRDFDERYRQAKKEHAELEQQIKQVQLELGTEQASLDGYQELFRKVPSEVLDYKNGHETRLWLRKLIADSVSRIEISKLDGSERAGHKFVITFKDGDCVVAKRTADTLSIWSKAGDSQDQVDMWSAWQGIVVVN